MTYVSVCDRFVRMRQTSPLYDLVQTRLGRALWVYLDDAAGAGRDWRTIARDLSSIGGISVSHETARRWHQRYSPDRAA